MRTDMELMNRLFHSALRRDLKRVINALAEASNAPPAQRAALGEHVILVLDLLHHHHTGEDTGLWPLVRRRAPDLGAELDAMDAEHAAVAGVIAATRAAARQYAAVTDSAAAAGGGLQQALGELEDVLLPHTY